MLLYFWHRGNYSFFIFHSFLIANEVTVFFVSSIAPRVAFFLISQRCLPAIKTDQPCRERERERKERDQPLYHSHIICTHYSCTWQHNYQSSGPVQLKASGCWQTGVWVKGTWQRWVKISAKVFEDSNCPSVLTMLTVIEEGSWITRKSFTILATDVSCQTI